MKFFLNILPAICFFLTYKLTGGDLIWATGAIVISSLLAFSANFALYRRVSKFQIILIAVLLIFAVPTLFLKDPSIIKLKVSIVNIAIAATLLIIQFVCKKNIVEAVSGIKTPIPALLWQKATIAVAVYLFVCAGINYILAFMMPDLFGITPDAANDIWVGYKTYGNAILNFIFILIIAAWMMNKLTPEQREELETLMTDLKKNRVKNTKDEQELKK